METVYSVIKGDVKVSADGGRVRLRIPEHVAFDFDREAITELVQQLMEASKMFILDQESKRIIVKDKIKTVEYKQANFLVGESVKEIEPGIFQLDWGSNTVLRLTGEGLAQLETAINQAMNRDQPAPVLSKEIEAIEEAMNTKQTMLKSCIEIMDKFKAEFESCNRDKEMLEVEIKSYARVLEILKNK